MNVTGPFIRHVAYPAMERLKHNRIRTNMAELVHSERQSADELHTLQVDKLRRLLMHAVLHVPAYREYTELLPVIQSNPVESLSLFPVLTKRDFRARRDDFLCTDINRQALILNRSGGSTGEPVTFYMDRHTVEYSEAARWRGLSWWGIRIGDPCVMIWGSPIELTQHQARKHRIYERVLKNRIVIPAFDLNPQKVHRYIKQMESFHPAYLYAWPSTLELFANLIEQSGHKPKVSLKAIVSTAEILHPHQRELFTRVFACPVVNEYGAREGGILGYECPHGNIHATVENSWMEVLERTTLTPVGPGDAGLLLVTDLNNYVMPRIRYQLGDVVSVSWDDCGCGRGLPLLKSLEGRDDDTFVSLNGSYVNGQYFTNVARTLPSIQQFQIIQTSVNDVTLNILEHKGLEQGDIEAFSAAIRGSLGNVHIQIQRMPEIPVSGSGKYRSAIRRFSLE